MRIALLCGAVLLACASCAPAATQRDYQLQVPEEAAGRAEPPRAPMNTEAVVGLYVFGTGILVFTGILFWLTIRVMRQAGKDLSDAGHQRILCVILVVGVGGFLVVAGYSAAQLAGLFGIMGSVVGYIFGQGRQEKRAEAPAEKPPA